MSSPKGRASLLAIMFLCLAPGTRPETANAPAPLTSAQIVEQMRQHNESRTEALKHYKAVRHYQVEYKGYGAGIAAKMEVEVIFDAPAGKSFRILTQSGSKVLIDKVLKRLLTTEKEAGQNRSATALTPANYTFRMAGSESVAGRPAYMLDVQPLVASKLLYRGRIWVDTADFAVVKIEAQPASNPSFWIARTDIRHTYAKTGEFWLPQQNRSVSKIRVGGTAVLTIDYGTYEVVPDASDQVAGTRQP